MSGLSEDLQTELIEFEKKQSFNRISNEILMNYPDIDGDLYLFIRSHLHEVDVYHLLRRTDQIGCTLLHYAASLGYNLLMDLLLTENERRSKDRANLGVVNLSDINGRVPLHFSAIYGHRSCVLCLLAHHATSYKKDINDKSPLYYSRSVGALHVAKLIKRWSQVRESQLLISSLSMEKDKLKQQIELLQQQQQQKITKKSVEIRRSSKRRESVDLSTQVHANPLFGKKTPTKSMRNGELKIKDGQPVFTPVSKSSKKRKDENKNSDNLFFKQSPRQREHELRSTLEQERLRCNISLYKLKNILKTLKVEYPFPSENENVEFANSQPIGTQANMNAHIYGEIHNVIEILQGNKSTWEDNLPELLHSASLQPSNPADSLVVKRTNNYHFSPPSNSGGNFCSRTPQRPTLLNSLPSSPILSSSPAPSIFQAPSSFPIAQDPSSDSDTLPPQIHPSTPSPPRSTIITDPLLLSTPPPLPSHTRTIHPPPTKSILKSPTRDEKLPQPITPAKLKLPPATPPRPSLPASPIASSPLNTQPRLKAVMRDKVSASPKLPARPPIPGDLPVASSQPIAKKKTRNLSLLKNTTQLEFSPLINQIKLNHEKNLQYRPQLKETKLEGKESLTSSFPNIARNGLGRNSAVLGKVARSTGAPNFSHLKRTRSDSQLASWELIGDFFELEGKDNHVKFQPTKKLTKNTMKLPQVIRLKTNNYLILGIPTSFFYLIFFIFFVIFKYFFFLIFFFFSYFIFLATNFLSLFCILFLHNLFFIFLFCFLT